MLDITTGRDSRWQGRVEGDSIYAKESRSRESSIQRQTREAEERERKL